MIHTITVHYSATYPDADYTWARLEADHIARGFRKGGYHWYIRRNGALIKGRAEDVLGAHVRGANSGNIGICWEGGLERATGPDKGVWNPTKAQEEQLVKLIKDIQKRWTSATRVVGHVDLAATQCPGLPKGGVAKWWAERQNTPTPAKEHWLITLIKKIIATLSGRK